MYDAGMIRRLRVALVSAWMVMAIGTRLCAQAPPVTVLDDFGRGVAKLDGQWQFHLGDNGAWAAPDIDDATGHDGWEQITADAPWGAQGHRSYTGYSWYRIHLKISPAAGTSGDFALLAARIESTAEFYWNGVLVARSGKMPPYPRWTYDDPTVEGDEEPQVLQLGQLREGVLAVRVWFRPLWSYDDGLQGGFYDAPILGNPDVIAEYLAAVKYRQLRGNQYSYALQSIYALLMVLGFAGWLRHRSQRALLWMAVFCLGDLGMAMLGFLQNWLSFNMGYFWEQIWISVRDIGLWYLLLWLLELHENRRLLRVTAVLAWIDLFAGFADGLLAFVDVGDPATARAAQIADAVLTVPLVGLSLYALVLVGLAVQKKLAPSRWSVAIFAFATGALADVVTLLHQGRRFTHWTIADTIDAPLFTIAGNPINAQTMASTGLIFAIIYAVYSYAMEESRKQSAIAQEMRNAREVQQVLVPQEAPEVPGFRFESVYKPAGEVGGDFFQIVPTKDGGVLVVIGDVSGKGMPAAMTVSLLVGTLRALAYYTQRPGEILAAMNRRMLTRSNGGFTTCLAVHVNAGGLMTTANAGHLAPYRNGEEIELENGFPLGITADVVYAETKLQLEADDTLTFLSDGVVEARNASGELLGFERTQLLATEPAEKVAQAAEEFGQEDDITVLRLTMVGQLAVQGS
jgi:Stage II sporulation protein E (SpoIIE)